MFVSMRVYNLQMMGVAPDNLTGIPDPKKGNTEARDGFDATYKYYL